MGSFTQVPAVALAVVLATALTAVTALGARPAEAGVAVQGPPALLSPASLSPSNPQLRLAEALADADSIDCVRTDRAGGSVTFGIEHAGEAYEIVASIGPDGDVTAVHTSDAGRGTRALGPLSWLADAMSREAAVMRLELDEHGGATVVTDDGARFVVATACGVGDDLLRTRGCSPSGSG